MGETIMTRTALYAAAGLALAAVIGPVSAADEEPPEFWAVTGVASDDVLHLRDVPSAESKSLARIPPNAHGLKHIGCRRNEVAFDQSVRMSDAARKAALTQWCRVEYRGQQGWVAGRYLKRDTAR